MNPSRLAPVVLAALAGAVAAAPTLPPAMGFEAARAHHDALAARYRALVARAAGILHPLALDEPLEIPLELPAAPGPLGALGEEGLARLPGEVLAALRRRIANERDRGYLQWELSATAPARYRTHQPRDEDGTLAWSENVFTRWAEFTPEPRELPVVDDLVAGLVPGDATPRAPRPPEAVGHLEAELARAIDDAARYRPQVEVEAGRRFWVNAGYWQRLRARARRWAFALKSAVEVAGQRADDALVAQLARELPRLEVPAVADDAWDERVDTALLPRLPVGLRVAIERRLAGAYFRGAWEAKFHIHEWWLRHGRTPEEFADLRQGKREVDLQGTYRYRIEAPRGHSRAALRTDRLARAG